MATHNAHGVRRALPVLVLISVAGLSACSGSSAPAAPQVAAGVTVTVKLTNAGCAPDVVDVPPGRVGFVISNANAPAVTQLQLRSGTQELAAVSGVAPGTSQRMSVQLGQGTYRLVCPGGYTPGTTALTVGGVAGTRAESPALKAALAVASTAYAAYVVDQVGQLVTATVALDDAIVRGDLPAARTLYATPRVFYERIEPVSEAFGNLDPRIDARINDVANVQSWSGFHKIEAGLFANQLPDRLAPIAVQLTQDVKTLQRLVAHDSYTFAELATGATTLLNEVAQTKITGEEERYAHIDLVDFQANVNGSAKAFGLLVPALQLSDAPLAAEVTGRFTALNAKLATYRSGAGPTSFVSYSTVPQAQRPTLSALLDALAEPLSRVAGQLSAAGAH